LLETFDSSTGWVAGTDVANITTANPWTLILVQLTKDVARAVVGQDITTIQWEEKGGLVLKFKVMAIMVPQLRATFAGNCGILHANASSGV
jgi:hydroxymethylglutaryl-CoA reductase